jgi:hypothetical protein
MPRIYRVVGSVTLTNAGGNADLLNISPADDKPCQLVGWSIGQTSEEGDVAAEAIRLTVRHLAATVTDGSGGSSPTTVTPPGLAAPGFTARINDTTVATTSGADDILEEHAWNVQASPWERFLPEELQEATLVRQGRENGCLSAQKTP